MIHIAIVDDLESDREVLKKFLSSDLSRLKIKYDITEFENGESFLHEYSTHRFQIIFLDIYMNGINGIQVAELLGKQSTKCKVIFLTTSTEHVTRSFAMKATCYLLKPVKLEDLQQALTLCFPQKNDGDVFPMTVGHSTELIPRDKILYIEYMDRCTQIHTSNQTWKSYLSFSKAIAPLADDPRFFICHRGILVNVTHIEQQLGNDFLIEGGVRIPISRTLKKNALNIWRHYKLENMWGNQ